MWRGRDLVGLLGPKGSFQASQGPVELVLSSSGDVERSARRFTLWSLAGKPVNMVSLFASLAAGGRTPPLSMIQLMGSPSHSLTMGWEMLHTFRVVEPTQGFTNSRGINQLFIDNWLSLFEMTSIVRENPSTDEGIRGTPAKKQSTLDRGS
ncbi:hypothetical protein ASPFODRAFT_65430 [Aspergillus luchuensis CBS 106.47]|uniref:Uncharacterized protein n=1 Tax=Aspergillus luchuensis (strain CBS 106.47) TaxID=1137211 RepID=A0A1M3T2F8_ASPLC|nr:hypothetical protein ASPFODRAFT_65430 [Aspergillus luchuensis CBS 106.47]